MVGKRKILKYGEVENKDIFARSMPETNVEDIVADIIYDVRKNGYGIDNEENEEGVYCIAATLPKIGDNPANAFSISAPVQRLNEETVSRNISLLLKTKEEISKVL